MKLCASSAPETVVGIVASKNSDHSSMVTMMQEPVSLRRKQLPLCEEKQSWQQRLSTLGLDFLIIWYNLFQWNPL